MTTLILLVFIQGQDATTPFAEALVRAAEQALGPGASVLVRAAREPEMSEGAALQAGRAVKAFAVARVARRAALGSGRVEARAVLTIVATGRSTAQTLSFDRADAPLERGRALGLVLAAMAQPERAPPAALPANAGSPPPAAAPAPPPAASRAAPPSAPVGASDVAVDTSGTAAPGAESAAPIVRTVPSPSAEPPADAGRLRWALDAAAEQGFSLGGAGTGIGATIGLRWRPWRRVGFRAGVRARFGEVEAAQASSRAMAASLGASFALVVPADGSRSGDGGGRFGLALRMEALLLEESLSHLSSDDPSAVRSGRWLPGAQLLGEAQWALGPAIAVLVDAGPEVALGRTTVFLHGAEVATLAPLRLVVQAGLLARF
jgi:hypothetical protein